MLVELDSSRQTIQELEREKLQLETNLGKAVQHARTLTQEQVDAEELLGQTKVLFVSQKLDLQGQLAALKDELATVQGQMRKALSERDIAVQRLETETQSLHTQLGTLGTAKHELEQKFANFRNKHDDEVRPAPVTQ